MLLTELPFGLPGRIFRCPMPFSHYDPQGDVIRELAEQAVDIVVILAEAEEWRAVIGQDLPTLYRRKGIQVMAFPIPDYGVPSKTELEQMLTRTIQLAGTGYHIAIHCYAGIGRTGLVAACLAKAVLGLSGQGALQWVRRYIPGAVESPVQLQMVLDDDANFSAPCQKPPPMRVSG